MEPINWHSLTPAQRDETIHEKVFGHRRTTKHFLSPDFSNVWEEAYKINSYQTWQTGGPHTPCYSQSLDAAWLVLQEMVRPFLQSAGREMDQRFETFADVMLENNGWGSSSAYGEIYPACEMFVMMAQWKPEHICVAALKALGYEVLTEEVK